MPSIRSPSRDDHPGAVIDQGLAEPRGQHAVRPAPCRPRSPGPGRAGRWWSRSPGCSPYSGWPAAGECSWRKLLELLDPHAVVAGQVQQRVEQHRAVAGRQHEAVAVRPARIGGVELQEPGPQHGGDVGHAHRHARMAGLRRLHRVDRQRADGIGHAPLRRRRPRQDRRLQRTHGAVLRQACRGRHSTPFPRCPLLRAAARSGKPARLAARAASCERRGDAHSRPAAAGGAAGPRRLQDDRSAHLPADADGTLAGRAQPAGAAAAADRTPVAREPGQRVARAARHCGATGAGAQPGHAFRRDDANSDLRQPDDTGRLRTLGHAGRPGGRCGAATERRRCGAHHHRLPGRPRQAGARGAALRPLIGAIDRRQRWCDAPCRIDFRQDGGVMRRHAQAVAAPHGTTPHAPFPPAAAPPRRHPRRGPLPRVHPAAEAGGALPATTAPTAAARCWSGRPTTISAMGGHPVVVDAACAAARDMGAGAGGTRNISGTSPAARRAGGGTGRPARQAGGAAVHLRLRRPTRRRCPPS